MNEQAVLGIDPGSAKAGYALVDAGGRVLQSGIEPVATLAEKLHELTVERPVGLLAIGRGTGAKQIAAALDGLGLPVVFVDEYETSRRARELYFADHPPRGWRRLIPLGLQLPGRPIDDYAAVLIARKYLARNTGSPPPN